MTERERKDGEVPEGNRPARRLLGQVLVDGGFITPGDLERALEEQNHTNELLGEILVRMGLADPSEIAAVVSIQSDLASMESAVRAAAGVRRYLGELLVKARRINREQLEEALSEQRRTGEKLGEILVRRGHVSENELRVALSFQRAQAGGPESSVRLRLGEILVATGQITREQLESVLARQRLTKRNIGELLVESGATQHHQVARGIRLQEMLVTAALVAALSLADVAAAQELPRDRFAGSHGSARIQVTSRVPARATLEVLHQDRTVVVTAEDVSRGFVEARAASRILVRENSPMGYLLVFEGAVTPGAPFGRVSVRGLGREVEIGPGGGFIPHPHSAGPVAAELTYRFFLAKDVRPGTYPWPLSLSVRPL